MIDEQRFVVMQSVPTGFISFNRNGQESPWALPSGASYYTEDDAQMRMRVLCRRR